LPPKKADLILATSAYPVFPPRAAAPSPDAPKTALSVPVSATAAHYKTARARRADLIVHGAGLLLSIVGGALLVGRAHANDALIAATCVYALGMLAMFTCSAAYNFAPPQRQPILRKLDHAGIFVMIAGSYTPLFVLALSGAWVWSMTLAVWGVALFGVFAKLFLPGISKGFWVAIYLLLGWAGIVAVKPLMASLDSAVLWCIAAGGLFYTVGVGFYVRKSMVYNRAIWHAHVLGGALSHWCAIWLCLRPVPVA
jgi:hemolysin III